MQSNKPGPKLLNIHSVADCNILHEAVAQLRPGLDFLQEAVPDHLEDEEGDGQEGGAQEVPYGGEVGDGRVIRVRASWPHGVHQHLAQVQQHRHLPQHQATLMFV